jgi:hypothetical protein
MANPLGDRLTAALRALESQLSGGIANPLDEVQLRHVEQWLGAKRPLSEYSPRTRRRYLAAARKGEQRPNKSEYQRRKQRTAERYGGATPNKLTRMRKLARENERALRRDPQNANFSLDDDFLAAVADVYGPDFLNEVLKEQHDSIAHWDEAEDQSQGPQHKGNRRYFGREERETRLMRMRNRGTMANTDALYYYHGHL